MLSTYAHWHLLCVKLNCSPVALWRLMQFILFMWLIFATDFLLLLVQLRKSHFCVDCPSCRGNPWVFISTFVRLIWHQLHINGWECTNCVKRSIKGTSKQRTKAMERDGKNIWEQRKMNKGHVKSFLDMLSSIILVDLIIEIMNTTTDSVSSGPRVFNGWT